MSTINIRVLSSKLSSTQPFVNVDVDSNTTVSDLVKEALVKFDLTVSAHLNCQGCTHMEVVVKGSLLTMSLLFARRRTLLIMSCLRSIK